MAESALEKQATNEFKVAGHKVEIKIEKANGRGWCDHIYIVIKRLVWVEFKEPGEAPSRQQLKRHEELRQAGQEVYVIDNIQDFRRVVLRR